LRAIEATQFEDADKYASYLRTPAGRLRCDLTWENLRGFLPANAPQRRVLDLGGGTGSMSVRLAKMEFQVVLLDNSEEMLAIARKETEANGIAGRISLRRADACQLQELFEPESFDIVLCHNLLEYVAEPAAIVAKIARVLRKDGFASVLARNRAGEVLKAAIKSRDWKLAKANLSSETVVDSLYGKPVRVFNPKDLQSIFAWAGLDVVAEYGVRVFFDYLDREDLASKEAQRLLLELELNLGAQPNFAAIARYIQLVARRSRAQERER
jgi:SAM-dependent methyltransferase